MTTARVGSAHPKGGEGAGQGLPAAGEGVAGGAAVAEEQVGGIECVVAIEVKEEGGVAVDAHIDLAVAVPIPDDWSVRGQAIGESGIACIQAVGAVCVEAEGAAPPYAD